MKPSNVEKGNSFEERTYHLLLKALEDGKLPVDKEMAHFYRKKAYYSTIRESNIVFDLVIEVWLKNATRPSYYIFIECKSYSNSVPVDDIEEFASKIRAVTGLNSKGIIVTNSQLQKGAFNTAKNLGLMLINVSQDDTLNTLLEQKQRRARLTQFEKLISQMPDFIFNALGIVKVKGLNRLSSDAIENKINEILMKPDISIDYQNVEEIMAFFSQEYKIQFILDKRIPTELHQSILGLCNIKERLITIDRVNLEPNRFRFILGHELGHIFLHDNLFIDQVLYQNFSDSEYNFLVGKYTLSNDRQWIEWQANRFSIELFLPKKLFLYHFRRLREQLGVRNSYMIYLDRQRRNVEDFKFTLNELCHQFNMSKTSVQIRLEELGLLAYGKDLHPFNQLKENPYSFLGSVVDPPY